MSFFAKNVVHFGFFTNEIEYKREKQDFSNNFLIQKCQEYEFQIILYNWSISITAKGKTMKEIADMI